MAQTNATTIMKNLVSEKKTKITELKKEMLETANKVINSKGMETELGKHSVKFKWSDDKSYSGIPDGLTTEYNGNTYEVSFRPPSIHNECYLGNMWVKNRGSEWYNNDKPNIKGKDKQRDLQTLTDWYEVKDTLDTLTQSKVFVQLIGGMNDTNNQCIALQHEVNALETAIQTDNDKEINNEIEDILEYGGEVEVIPHTTCNYDFQFNEDTDEDERMYYLDTEYKRFEVNYKRNGVKDNEWTVMKVVVGDKVKGKQSYECEIFYHNKRDNQIQQFSPNAEVHISKNQLIDLLDGMLRYNKTTDFEKAKQDALEQLEKAKSMGYKVKETEEVI